MPSPIPQRVLFEDRRLLQADDLQEEQRYQLYRRWQHNLALHSWGILCGLEVTFRNPETVVRPGITIQPGMALDGYGRELVVTSALSDNSALDLALTYDVWLSYSVATVPLVDAVSDVANCESMPSELQRVSEEPTLLLTRTSARRSTQISEPPGVPDADLNYGPHQPPQFSPNAKWPVFLAKLEFREGQWNVDSTERRYGGLIAERIEFPKQREFAIPPRAAGTNACCQQGGEEATAGSQLAPEPTTAPRTILINGTQPDAPNLCFEIRSETETVQEPGELPPSQIVRTPLQIVRTPPAAAAQSGAAVQSGTATPDVKEETEIWLTADRVVAEADLVLQRGAALHFDIVPPERRRTPTGQQSPQPANVDLSIAEKVSAAAFEAMHKLGPGTASEEVLQAVSAAVTKVLSDAFPEANLPLRTFGIFRQFLSATTDAANPQLAQPDGDTNRLQFADVLQFSIPKSVTDGRNRIEIGATDAKGKFTPILVIQEDETVTIYGTLRVHGPIFGEQTDIPANEPSSEAKRLISRFPAIFSVGTLPPKQLLVKGFVEAIEAPQNVHQIDGHATWFGAAKPGLVAQGLKQVAEAQDTDHSDKAKALLKEFAPLGGRFPVRC